VILLLLSTVLSFSGVQTQLGNYATRILKERADVQIAIKKIDLSYLGRIKLNELLIKDHHNDTLIAVANLQTSLLSLYQIFQKEVSLGAVVLENGRFNLTTYLGESQNNLTVFSKKLKPNEKTKDPSFQLTSDQIQLRGIDFEISNQNKEENISVAFYKNIQGDLTEFELKGNEVSVNLKALQFIDNHGLEIQDFTTSYRYTPSKMLFKQLHLQTKSSLLKADITFEYKLQELKDFVNKVRIDASFHESKLSLQDLNRLYAGFGESDVLHFSTKCKGTLNDFNLTQFDLQSDQKLVAKGDFHFKNSFRGVAAFSMKADMEQVESNYGQLKRVLPSLLGRNIPTELKKIGNFTLQGTTAIDTALIDLDLKVISEMGSAIASLKLTNFEKIDEASYAGMVKISNFKLGKFINDPLIGKISLEGLVKGNGFTLANMNASFDGKVTKHQYKGYTYQKIRVKGFFKNKLFNGNLQVNDPNIQLDFKGLADFSSRVNKFDFKAAIGHANFNKLNLFKRDSIAVLKGDIRMDFSGNTLDELQGNVRFSNSSYTNEHEFFEFKDFNISASLDAGIKTLQVQSKDLVDGQVKGVFRMADIGPMVKNALGSMSANYSPVNLRAKGQFFEFDFQIHNEIIAVFLPQVHLASSSVFKGKVIDESKEIKLLLKASKLRVSNTILDSVYLQIDNKNPVLNTNFTIEKVTTPGYTMRNLNLLNKTLNDTLYFRADFTGGKENKERFDLSFYYAFDDDKNSVIGIQKSKIHFKGKDWFLNSTNNKANKLIFDLQKQYFNFKAVEFTSGEQSISFEGSLRDATAKDLKINFDKVSLGAICPKIDSLSLEGLVNGKLHFKQEKGVYQPYGKMRIDAFRINEFSQGDLILDLQAEDSYKKYRVDLQLLSDSYKKLNAQGTLDLTPKTPTIDLSVDLDGFQLNAFSPLGKNILSNIRGVADGQFQVSGPLKNPNMDGFLSLSSAGLTVPYLNVDYNFIAAPKIRLSKQSFVFDSLLLQDTKANTQGVLTGDIQHRGFKNWRLDLNLRSNKLLVLNTQDSENASYYGTGIIDGEANIKGLTNDLQIDVKAKTLSGTRFVIPLNDVKTIQNSDLIHFKKVEKTTEIDPFFDKASLLKKIQGISLNFDLNVTKVAEAEIVIDRISGSSLKGNGTGNLLVEIDTKGKFEMFGDFLIENGIYNFAYGGLINKPFEVRKGGVISWDGDPFEADLNLEAVHRVKANPKILLDNLNTNRKIPIDLVTKVEGKLFNSTEEFNIVIPNSSSLVASELDFKLNENDDNTKMRQFFSLLISKSFFNENNLEANRNAAISGTTSEIISGALSDIFNKEGDKFQIGLGYTSGEKSDVETQNIDDLVDISLATQINDRILINGKLGVPVGAKTQSTVIGEVKVEFLVDEAGKLRWTIFNRQNEIQYSEEEEGYTQGLGLSYQIDFDNLREMFQKLGLKGKKRNTFENKRTNSISEDLILVVPSLL